MRFECDTAPPISASSSARILAFRSSMLVVFNSCMVAWFRAISISLLPRVPVLNVFCLNCGFSAASSNSAFLAQSLRAPVPPAFRTYQAAR